MSIFNDNIRSKTITEQVMDFAWEEFDKNYDGRFLKIKNGDGLYRYLVQNNFPGKSSPWFYYILKGMDRLRWATGKTYDFHVEKWGPENGYLTGHTKAIVVTEI